MSAFAENNTNFTGETTQAGGQRALEVVQRKDRGEPMISKEQAPMFPMFHMLDADEENNFAREISDSDNAVKQTAPYNNLHLNAARDSDGSVLTNYTSVDDFHLNSGTEGGGLFDLDTKKAVDPAGGQEGQQPKQPLRYPGTDAHEQHGEQDD